ncbi:MAG: helix-turn-helix transcriptional regulator [Candidatus Latescibacteria bacterium]|nr:helix-turn-helix transcriptional regulator [Candidatus Latescibacterota bacterium]
MIMFKLPIIASLRGYYKQKEIAEGAGLHPNIISAIYRGTVRRLDIETLDKLCAFLRCNIQDILEYAPDERNNEKNEKEVIDPIYTIYEIAEESGISDLATNIDHYLYGLPKRCP